MAGGELGGDANVRGGERSVRGRMRRVDSIRKGSGARVEAKSVKDARNNGENSTEYDDGSGHVSCTVLVRSVPGAEAALVAASDGGRQGMEAARGGGLVARAQRPHVEQGEAPIVRRVDSSLEGARDDGDGGQGRGRIRGRPHI